MENMENNISKNMCTHIKNGKVWKKGAWEKNSTIQFRLSRHNMHSSHVASPYLRSWQTHIGSRQTQTEFRPITKRRFKHTYTWWTLNILGNFAIVSIVSIVNCKLEVFMLWFYGVEELGGKRRGIKSSFQSEKVILKLLWYVTMK